jgi:hypothetical protein
MENKENMNEEHSSTWEIVDKSKPLTHRLKVPGGWLVTISGGFSFPLIYYPDPEHKWNPRIK